jgi:hypothetical protein
VSECDREASLINEEAMIQSGLLSQINKSLKNREKPQVDLTLSDSTLNLVRQCDFPVPLRCRKTSDKVFVVFFLPLSEPVRRFSSCSMDFSQQIAQVVLFLFLPVFLNCMIITSNPPTSFPPKTNKSWGVCRLEEKLDWKELTISYTT